MKPWKILSKAILPILALLALTPSAYAAADYSFETTAPQDYYKSTSYEDIYGSQYNYGGKNVVDYQVPELEYGVQSTTMTGVMERTILPGLQQTVATGGGGSGVHGGLDRAYVPPHHDGDQAAADLDLSDEGYVSRLDHGVRRLDSADQASGFDHSKSFFHFDNLRL